MSAQIDFFVVDDLAVFPMPPEKTLFWMFTWQGERIVVIHGNQTGQFSAISRMIYRKTKPDKIYCCYPKRMYRLTGDERIQHKHEDAEFLINVNFVSENDPKKAVISIRKA